MAQRVGIYSALYGNYDTVKPLPSGLRGDIFTDFEPDHPLVGWDVHRIPHSVVSRHGDPRIVAPMLAHKFWKMHPGKALPDVDISIWVDASITLHDGFVEHALAALGDDDWTLIRHPWRTCIFDEASYSATLPRYASLAGSIRDQATWYRHLGHPPRWGLPATGVLVRRHTQAVIALSEHWWQECLGFSHQDQVSLPVLLRLFEDRVKFNWNLGWLDKWDLHPHLK